MTSHSLTLAPRALPQNTEAARTQVEQARAQMEQARAQMEQAREQIRAEIEAARAAQEAAREAQIVIREEPMPFGPQIPEEAVVMSLGLFAMIAVIAIARAFGRRWSAPRAAAAGPEVTGRLERIEQAVDAIALEVERIAEGQRFTTKVMAELRGLPAPNAAAALDATLLQGAREREGAPVRDRTTDR
jgi:hypothetical protein